MHAVVPLLDKVTYQFDTQFGPLQRVAVKHLCSYCTSCSIAIFSNLKSSYFVFEMDRLPAGTSDDTVKADLSCWIDLSILAIAKLNQAVKSPETALNLAESSLCLKFQHCYTNCLHMGMI